ncbi:carboxylating nicotinate-nucleotide diphosphorylase [Methanosarcinaceae archaeon]|nr:carboxylating nicotinate-nucleotide diphosphorylase [Methanosarcinaceae archaeon]
MILQCEAERFLDEDLRYEDISCTLVPSVETDADIFVKEPCVLSGTEMAETILNYMGISYEKQADDGDRLSQGDVIFRLHGNSVSVLRAERLVLNFLSHLSGVATETSEYVSVAADACRKAGVGIVPKIACTRKTMPGLRKYEKEAVRDGGGDAHRNDLSDCVMIKDNHIAVMGLENAVRSAREKASFTKKIDVETESPEDAVSAAALGADIVMLDNMRPDMIRKTVRMLEEAGLRDRIILEASGGIHKGNLEEYAVTGIDVISISAIVTQAKWIDISLDVRQS